MRKELELLERTMDKGFVLLGVDLNADWEVGKKDNKAEKKERHYKYRRRMVEPTASNTRSCAKARQ